VAVGIAVLSVGLGGRNRRILIGRTVMILVTGLVIYQLLPSADAARLTSFTGAAGSSGAYNIDVRVQYAHDAEQLISAHPLIGVGVGNYLAGSAADGTQTTDPHDVILLEAAEGGIIFAASFILLIGGAASGLWRMRRTELAPAALAILLATVAHGLVDVYWVRGLPVLGFLLVGMACGLAKERRSAVAA
jgi:O-antigen ligase